jgi:IS605 OrfB family transposase
MLVFEYKAYGKSNQFSAVDEAIRTVQFIRNKAIRLWMNWQAKSCYDLNKYCAVLAKEFPFANQLNSMARQAAAERAWASIQRFYDNCKNKIAGKKGFPQFQKDNRSVEYKTSGWALSDNRKSITFTDKKGIGKLKLKGTRDLNLYQPDQIKISRQRKDHAVKLARCVIRSNDLVAYEDLRVRNMVKNHCLAKSISDAGWYQFRVWLETFGRIFGRVTVAVNPAYTSQECSSFGTVVKKSLSTRTHACQCGFELGRDYNAALNILTKAISTTGHVGTSILEIVNASGDRPSTFAGANLRGQGASLIEESPYFQVG